MANYLKSLIEGHFATGVLHYEDAYPGQEDLARIVVTATVENRFPTQFVVDTGSPWCILHPEIAQVVANVTSSTYVPQEKLTLRNATYRGSLHRMRLTLAAEEGKSIEVEATVFVPMLSLDQTWPYPNFIGLDGFLNRINFAIAPEENAFYFGAE